MGEIVFQGHFSVMRVDDGLAQRQPKPKASAAVANGIAPGKEHFKNSFLSFIRDTGSIVADTDLGQLFSLDCRDSDVRACRSVFDGVVHQIDNHLHDKPRIHPHQQRNLSAIHRNVALFCSPVNMPEGFRYHILQDLVGKLQLYAAVRNFCGGEQIFYEAGQPLGIIIDVRKNLLPRWFIQSVIAVQQRIGVA